MNEPLPDRDGGTCRRCGRELVLRDPTHGKRYWTCPESHDPPVVTVGPENVRWTVALIRTRIYGTFDGRVAPFSADTSGPGSVRWALCERLHTITESARDTEAERRVSKRETRGGDGQTPLGAWSE